MEKAQLMSAQLLDNIFNLTVTASISMAQEGNVPLQEGKEQVAQYLEKIINGLRYEESSRKD
jgi:hypothetical protein